MGNSAPKKRPSAPGNKKAGSPPAADPPPAQEKASVPATTAPASAVVVEEEPKKRTSILGRRKSSVKPEKNLLEVTIDESEKVIKLKYDLQGGVDPSSSDLLAIANHANGERLWSKPASGGREDQVLVAFDELTGLSVGTTLVAKYFNGGDEDSCKCSSESFTILIGEKEPEPVVTEEQPEPIAAEVPPVEERRTSVAAERRKSAVTSERPKSVAAAPAVPSISLKWKNDDVVVIDYSLAADFKPTSSDRVAICLVSSSDADRLNYEYASGKSSGSVEMKRSSFTRMLDPIDQQKLEARYYSSDSDKPILRSKERITLPMSTSARESVVGAKPLPVKEDESASAVKGFAMSISWDEEQEMFKFKVKPPKDVALGTSHEVWLVEASKKDQTNSNHGCARFDKGYELGQEAESVWGINTNLPLPVVKYCVLLTEGSDRKPLAVTEEFSFPAYPRMELFPKPDERLSATWSVEDQCVKVAWKGTQSDEPYYKSIYVYESGVKNKCKQIVLWSIPHNAWSKGEGEILAQGKLRENGEYYVRLIESKTNSALKCLACSLPFTITQLENEDEEKQYCDFTVLGEEQESYQGYDSSTCTVSWKFSRKAPGISSSDHIIIQEADKPVNLDDWQAISCYASGNLEGKVTFSLGGLCEEGKQYRFYYVVKVGKGKVYGKSDPVAFTQLVQQSAEANEKAKEASRKANMSSMTQYSMDAIKTFDEYNPLLTIRPEPNKFEKLLQDNLNKRKKRRASADMRAEQQLAQAAATSAQASTAIANKEADKPLTGSELFEMVLSDFSSKGGFIYAGAGVSMAAPASSPSWWVLMNDLLRETFNGAPAEHADLRNKIAPGDVSRQPEEIMESFYLVLQDRLLTVFELLEAGEPNSNHKAMAKLAKAGKLRGILTTNFDIFIERALKAEGVAFKTVVTAEEFQAYYDSGCKEFAVLKIHGTVDRPSTIVAVANHYKSGKGFSGAKELVLGHFLRHHPTLFLGYSGWDFAHQNYQSFWAGEGEAGGENVYWLNLIGAKGPDLKKILGTHIGKRLMVGEDMMPAWALNLLGVWDQTGAKAITDFDAKLDRDAIQKSLVTKRETFLKSWVAKIPKPQLLTLLEMEAVMLNQKNQERFKRLKEANKDSSEDTAMDSASMTKLLTQMAMDMSAGKMTMEEYMEQTQLITLKLTFKYVNMPKEKKDKLMKLYLKDTQTNPLFASAEKQLNKSMMPTILSSVVDGLPSDTPVEEIYAQAVQYVAEKMEANELKGDKLSKAKRTLYMYQSQYLRCDAAGRAECEKLLDDFAKLAVEKGWDDSTIAREGNAQLMKKILSLAYGTIDVEAIQQTQFKELLEIKNDSEFLTNALCVAMGSQRTAMFKMINLSMIPEYSTMIAMPLYAHNDKRELPPGRLEEFEALLKTKYSPEKQNVMKRLAKMKDAAAEVLATFEIGDVEVWVMMLRTSGVNYQEETSRDAKGFYPRECLPEGVCKHFLPKIKTCYSRVKDSRIVQPILALMTIVGESLNDLDSLKYATEESLRLTNGKVIELTPVGIPESLAYALQTRNQLAEALPYYLKALDGIKTSVMRHKTDAIVLQACLVQGQFDKEKALRLAFTYSPHFGSAQQYTTAGPGRSLLVQQCQKWAEDLGYGTLDTAEEKLMRKD